MKRKRSADRQFSVSRKEAATLVLRYIRKRVSEQLKTVTGIIIYLILFQIIVLGIPITDASVIGLGMLMVIIGLTFFLEGLLLGIMPMGEEIGIRLPQKVGHISILVIAFVLGLGATLAEPAIAVLKAAGSSVHAWQTPLLYLMLNKYAAWLVAAVGFGVGIAMILSMIRFIRGHSLKPYLYAMISLLLALSLFAWLDPNLRHILGLAWDCGGVTTGPVTVPLVLALGIGISHVANRGGSKTEGGFGVVTMASLIPVIMVIIMGIFFSFSAPAPQTDVQFFSNPDSRIVELFEDETHLKDYAIANATYEAQLQLFDNDAKALRDYLVDIGQNPERISQVFGSKAGFLDWVQDNGDEPLKEQYSPEIISAFSKGPSAENGLNNIGIMAQIRGNFNDALLAVVPLSIFLLGVLYFILRERLAKADEVFLGLAFAIIGMTLFGGGIELGLAKVGDQVGSNLPVSFARMQYPDEQRIIPNFDEEVVNTAIKADGSQTRFFYYEEAQSKLPVTYQPEHHDPARGIYRYIPMRGPLFGDTPFSLMGILVVLLFAFVMGYSATLAEPALNALGLTVEDMTVGAFRKSMLLQAVALGVGAGIMLGVAKIIWDIPLFWLLAPLYLLLLFLTHFSSEEFVNIGWDSAGVTTGPITVPLVLSMGLGIGSQVGVVEGFGILSLASACPIISVLGMGLYVNYKRGLILKEYGELPDKAASEDIVL